MRKRYTSQAEASASLPPVSRPDRAPLDAILNGEPSNLTAARRLQIAANLERMVRQLREAPIKIAGMSRGMTKIVRGMERRGRDKMANNLESSARKLRESLATVLTPERAAMN